MVWALSPGFRPHLSANTRRFGCSWSKWAFSWATSVPLSAPACPNQLVSLTRGATLCTQRYTWVTDEHVVTSVLPCCFPGNIHPNVRAKQARQQARTLRHSLVDQLQVLGPLPKRAVGVRLLGSCSSTSGCERNPRAHMVIPHSTHQRLAILGTRTSLRTKPPQPELAVFTGRDNAGDWLAAWFKLYPIRGRPICLSLAWTTPIAGGR
jgi:hypothetical protein